MEKTPRPGTQWSDIDDTQYLPGDMVRTSFGPAIIREAHKTQGRDTYAVWHLPGWTHKETRLGWDSPKGSWYDPTELELVEYGAASKIRQRLATTTTLHHDAPIPERVAYIRRLYDSLQPGQEVKVAAMMIDPASLDFYLSGICSGYTHGYRAPGARPDDFKNWVLFRMEKSLESDPKGRRSYVHPDRRHLYNYEMFTGIYTPKPTPQP